MQAGGGPWASQGLSASSPWQASATPSGGFVSSLGSAVGSAFGSAFSALGVNQFGRHGANALPTEAEVTETYAACGEELQAWSPALARVVDREMVEALLQQLDESDQIWQQALSARGWRLSTEAPRFQGCGSFGPSSQELSVFDRHLPRPFCEDPRAVEMWNHRQKLEGYLVHPSFEPAQRQFVLERLREWRSRGITNAMRSDFRPIDMMPTDAHILENLLVKNLNYYFDFANCFMASGQSPPAGKHLGQPASCYIRQVTDQSIVPRPAPHYEVVVMQKVWKIRPGNISMLEAFALLLHALRRHSRSYQTFPASWRNALEGGQNQQANIPLGTIPNRSPWSMY